MSCLLIVCTLFMRRSESLLLNVFHIAFFLKHLSVLGVVFCTRSSKWLVFSLNLWLISKQLFSSSWFTKFNVIGSCCFWMFYDISICSAGYIYYFSIKLCYCLAKTIVTSTVVILESVHCSSINFTLTIVVNPFCKATLLIFSTILLVLVHMYGSNMRLQPSSLPGTLL